jgi:hypothetical protein
MTGTAPIRFMLLLLLLLLLWLRKFLLLPLSPEIRAFFLPSEPQQQPLPLLLSSLLLPRTRRQARGGRFGSWDHRLASFAMRSFTQGSNSSPNFELGCLLKHGILERRVVFRVWHK